MLRQMIMKVMVVGEAIMPMLAFIFTTTDGTTGITGETLTDGAGTILVMQDTMLTDGVDHGDGTDGTTGDIQVSDLVI